MDSKVLTEDIIPNLKAKVDSARKIAYYHIQFQNISDSPSSSDIVYSTLAEQVQQGYQIVFLVTRTDSTTSITNETWFMQRYYNVYNSAPFNGIILEMTCSGVDTFKFPEVAPLDILASYIVKVSSDDSSLSVSKYTAATTDLSNVEIGSVTHPLLAADAVQSDNIDYSSLLRFPMSTNTVLADIGEIATTRYYDVPATGFLMGIADVADPGNTAYVTTGSGPDGVIAGVNAKQAGTGTLSVGFSVPVCQGQTIAFVIGGGCKLRNLKIKKPYWAAVS